MIKQLFVASLLFLSLAAKAQFYGVQVGSAFDTPIGQLAYTFKPTVAFHLDVLRFYEDENKTVNFTIGYNTFKPKEEIFYFLTDGEPGYGTTVYSDYKIIPAYLGWMKFFNFSEQMRFGLGFNFGAYFSHFTTESQNGGTSSDISDINAYIAPKTGLSYDFSNYLQINLQAKYNFFAPTGKNDARTPAFNDGRVGTIYRSWSSGLALAYKF